MKIIPTRYLPLTIIVDFSYWKSFQKILKILLFGIDLEEIQRTAPRSRQVSLTELENQAAWDDIN
jgi:hypothetical protein